MSRPLCPFLLNTVLMVSGCMAVTGCQGQLVYANRYEMGYNNISWVRGARVAGGLMVSARPLGDSLFLFAGSMLRTDNSGSVLGLACYNDGGTDMVTCMESAANGDVLAGSSTKGHFGDPVMADLMIRRVEEDGDLLWANAYKVDGENECNVFDLVQVEADAYVGLGYFAMAGNGTRPLVFKLSGTGQVLWARGLESVDGSFQLLTLIRDPAGGMVATGWFSGVPGITKMALVHLDTEGHVDWAHWYGSEGYNMANLTLAEPDGGFAVLGRLTGNSGTSGAVVRTRSDGIPLSMTTWGYEVAAGHCFADGSLLLMSPASDGCVFARLDTSNALIWSVLLHTTSWGELLPFGNEETRFAYVSSEMFGAATIHLFTDQGGACDAEPGPYTEVAPTWADHGLLEVNDFNVPMASVPLVMQLVPIPTTMEEDCSVNIGVGELHDLAGHKVTCAFNARRGSLHIIGAGTQARSVQLVDVLGHQWPLAIDPVRRDDGSIEINLPQDLSPGYYVASTGFYGAGCAFAVQPE